jgi:hypothetical protein
MTINERNQYREKAGLPLLDAEAEGARLATVQRDAAFEQYYREHRNRFAHLWADASQGWLSRAGLWAQARRQLRLEFETIVGK